MSKVRWSGQIVSCNVLKSVLFFRLVTFELQYYNEGVKTRLVSRIKWTFSWRVYDE